MLAVLCSHISLGTSPVNRSEAELSRSAFWWRDSSGAHDQNLWSHGSLLFLRHGCYQRCPWSNRRSRLATVRSTDPAASPPSKSPVARTYSVNCLSSPVIARERSDRGNLSCFRSYEIPTLTAFARHDGKGRKRCTNNHGDLFPVGRELGLPSIMHDPDCLPRRQAQAWLSQRTREYTSQGGSAPDLFLTS